MLAQSQTQAAHVGEDQSSRQFPTRVAHYENVASELLIAAKKLAYDYLQEERDDVRLCANAEHNKAIRNLFAAIKNADQAGLSAACAVLAALELEQASRPPARDPRVPDMFETGGAA